MSKLLDAVCKSLGDHDPPDDNERFFLKTAALLHDIGHFPLSHTVERALERFEEFKLPQRQSANEATINGFIDYNGETKSAPVSRTKAALHEQLSAEIIKHTSISKKISEAFQHVKSSASSKFDLQSITYGILGESSELVADQNLEKDNLYFKLARFLLHSQLDADRLDYLLRDSLSAGVKPGGFDIDKLISEIKVIKVDNSDDSQKYHYGVSAQGLRNIEEYMLTRAYNYLEIVYEPVSHGLGMLAEEFYFQLLLLKHYKRIKKKYTSSILAYNEIKDLLKQDHEGDTFCDFDDYTFLNLIRHARAKNNDDSLFMSKDFPCEDILRSKEVIQTMAEMLSDGVPPQLIWRNELVTTEGNYKATNKLRKDNGTEYREQLLQAIEESGLQMDHLLISDKKSRIKLVDDDELEHLSIFTEDGSLLYNDFTQYPGSLFHPLKGFSIYVDSVFYIGLPDDISSDTEYKIRKFADCMSR
jgi:HD superfamily phosphohydrolase